MYQLTRTQAREFLDKLGLSRTHLPRIGKSLILSMPMGKAWKLEHGENSKFVLSLF